MLRRVAECINTREGATHLLIFQLFYVTQICSNFHRLYMHLVDVNYYTKFRLKNQTLCMCFVFFLSFSIHIVHSRWIFRVKVKSFNFLAV
jgi:hypothetical protein